MLLDECINVKSIIENEVRLYREGSTSELLNELPIVRGVSLSSYVSEIEQYILPQLDYIIDCLKNNKRIKKEKFFWGTILSTNGRIAPL